MAGRLVDRRSRFDELKAFYYENRYLPQPKIRKGLYEAMLANWMYRVIRPDTSLFLPEVAEWVAWARRMQEPEPRALPPAGPPPRRGGVRHRISPVDAVQRIKTFFMRHGRIPRAVNGASATETQLARSLTHWCSPQSDLQATMCSWRDGLRSWETQQRGDRLHPERLVRAALEQTLTPASTQRILDQIAALALQEVETLADDEPLS